MVVEMASDAGATARPDFIGHFYETHCEVCLNPRPDSKPAKILNKHMSTFIESKAAFKCFDFTVIPLTSYVTPEVMVSPQLLRFFLSNVHSIVEDWKFNMVKMFLEHHLMMHPPCRPGMPEYYLSVLNQNLGSFIFEKQLISDTFFDFIKRLKVAINQYTMPDKQSVDVSAISTRKEVMDFLKQTCKSSNKPMQDVADDQLDKVMLVFNYCVHILVHDFQISRKKNTIPLVLKIVWGSDTDLDAETPMNPHCFDVITMYLKAPGSHRQDIARYLTLLASVMQKGECHEGNLFCDLESNELVDAFVHKLTEKEDLSEGTLKFVSSLRSRLFQIQIYQTLTYQNLLDGADYPKKTALSRKNARPKNYFSIFDKKSNK